MHKICTTTDNQFLAALHMLRSQDIKPQAVSTKRRFISVDHVDPELQASLEIIGAWITADTTYTTDAVAP